MNGKAVIASLLVALVLLLDAMAVCPSLHELIHKDAGKADHECAVTIFARGQVDSATVDVAITGPQLFLAVAAPVEISAYRPVIENLPAGRAPPASGIAS